MRKVYFSSALLLARQVAAVRNIMDFGAIPDLEDTATAYANTNAIAAAINAANAADSTDREVHVPADMTFTLMPIQMSNLNNLTITVDGTLLASKNWLDYPVNSKG
jgi:polygalacturonase